MTPQEIAQETMMIQSKLRPGTPPSLVYRGAPELGIGELAQLAELMPYLTQTDQVPALIPYLARRRTNERHAPKTHG